MEVSDDVASERTRFNATATREQKFFFFVNVFLLKAAFLFSPSLSLVKFLEVIKPFCAVLPEIQKPERKVSPSLNIIIMSLNNLCVTIPYNFCFI